MPGRTPQNQIVSRLNVKVVPGTARSQIVGWLGESLKVRVAAPPERGKANLMVETIVCEALGLPAGSVRVVSGKNAPRKILEIQGLSAAEIRVQISSDVKS